MQNTLRTLALALIAGTAACASAPRGQGASADDTAVVFVNRSVHQADVYALPRSGARVRLGTVQAGRTDTLPLVGTTVPTGAVVIAADLLAVSATPTTGELTLNPGDWISVTLPSTANILNVLPVPR
jgi:hypothetical protein